MTSMWSRAIGLGAMWLAVSGAVGCAEEREPINKVQPYALAKSFFVGANLHDPADDPEFWTQGTIVDVGYGAAQSGLFTSTYAQPVSRIKWVIEEGMLVGRLTYERIDNSDGKGAGAHTTNGQIAVAYKILGHFDIRRDYNPSTGEETNVIVENSSDRPWYDREYMRVDWSKNLNVDAYDYDTLSLLGIYGGIQYESMAYYVNDPKSPDAPYFDTASGYFDVTNKAFAKPRVLDLSHLGWGIDKFPACYLDADFAGGTAPAGNCNPVEITIRQSFRRVVDTDYEPQNWDGYRFKAYGAFLVERYGYARNYGMTDTKWRRFITRYNLWERSHYYQDPATMTGPVECYTPATTAPGEDPHRDLNADGTEDECEAVGRGSRCDEFKQRCTLPFRDRKPVPLAWYYTEGSDLEYFDGTEWATHEWDVALRAAVMAARYAECNRVGDEDCSAWPMYFGQMDEHADAVALAREVDDCRHGVAHGDRAGQCEALADEIGAARGYDPAIIALAKMPEMVVLCHSPVAETDPAACGPRGLTVRQGDLRYHQVNVIATPQTPSPWGIYTDSEDPLTGEKIAASINVWSYVNDLWSQGVVDTMRYIKGELPTSAVTEGTYIKDWASAAQNAHRHGALPAMTSEQVNRRVAQFAAGTGSANAIAPETPNSDEQADAHAHHGQGVAATPSQPELTMTPTLKKQLHRLNQEVRAVAADLKAPSSTRPLYDARRKHAIEAGLEGELLTKAMQELGGIEGLPLSDEVLNAASPLRGGNPGVLRDLRNLKELALAEHGTCVLQEAPAPLAIGALADVMEAKFETSFSADDPVDVQLERAERIRKYIAQKGHYSVISHEMGHSIGMRHNFVSSSDAWNYRPQYWQLRTRNGEVATRCDSLAADGANCVGPRYYDPMTDEEHENLIWMFMQSSTMDYAGDPTVDMLGLGAYDFAAARMFYGESVAVHADDSFTSDSPRGYASLMKTDTFGGIVGIQPEIWDTSSNSARTLHYSELQNELELIQGCTPVDPESFRPAGWNEVGYGKWHPVVDGGIVAVGGVYSRCKQQRVDHVDWRTLRMPDDAEELRGGFYQGGPSVDPMLRTRVPYGFATDRWADLGNVSVYRHDNGADPYELFNFLITQQEVQHIFDNYRRNRQTFSVRGASSRVLARYNEKMRDAAKGLGLLSNIYRGFALEVQANANGLGFDFNSVWLYNLRGQYRENVLASGVAFDHFARQVARPEPGPHYLWRHTNVLRSTADNWASPGPTEVVIPNGATGYYKTVGIGGKPIENALAEDKGEYDAEYTVNCGSYYDKAYAAILFTESVDNFISDSRKDFLDARYRAVSLADLFPDGYRRWLAQNLTNDDQLKGVRLVANAQGKPNKDLGNPDPEAKQFPARPIGWTTWWTPGGPEACFPNEGTTLCSVYGAPDSSPFNPSAPANVAVVDPQIGWEQQKFLIAWTMNYLPENQQQWWLNQLYVWERGADSDPGFPNRIEFHHPLGRIYIAKAIGKETIYGKSVQKGIAARVLEYANELLFRAYATTPGPDKDQDGQPDWYIPEMDPATGQPTILYDATVGQISESGGITPGGKPGCNANENFACTCESNRACVELEQYVSVPSFLRQSLAAYGLADPSMKGLY